MTRFVDTNIFLRFLTGDDPVKSQQCFALFKHAKQNQVTLITSESVIAEIVYVLSSTQVYNLPRDEIRAKLYPLFSIPQLKLAHRKSYLRALDLFASSTLDFEDTLTLAQMEQLKLSELYSYDRGFDQIPNIKRIEP